ncbi:aminotransferase class I/II-fold pyridoxal phosphate-dependent enzyme [Nocardia brasiliensis]
MDEIMRLVRPAVRDLAPFDSARTEESRSGARIRLDTNENPYPPYPATAAQRDLNRYPERQPRLLLEAFAEFYGVPRESLLLTRDVDEAVDLLVRGFCAEGRDAILQTRPTFASYPHAAWVQGVDVLEVPLRPSGFQLDLPGILAVHEANPRTKLMFFCSPNDPTANLLDRRDILQIATALFGKVIVVVDQRFLDYSGAESLATAIPAHPNLVVLRSMSTEYGLAGERFGIAVAHPDIIGVLGRILAPCPLSRNAIRAVAQIMTLLGVLRSAVNIGKVLTERSRVTRILVASPAVVRVFPSDANFVLVQVRDARGLVTMMARSGIKISDGSTFPTTPNAVRITIGTPDENNAMLAVLDQYADEPTMRGHGD